MNNVLPRTKEVIQGEILNLNGHQNWKRITVHDFGGENVEFSLMPYETWGEVSEEDLHSGGLHPNWKRTVVNDFGGENMDFPNMPHETWVDGGQDEKRAMSARGEGDRARSAESAARRAKRKVRHLCKLLKARYMVTLTTKEIITDLDVMRRYLQEFVRRVRKVSTFEYVATHELQKRGALHLHIAVANKQEYKLLWSIWFQVVGKDQGRVHVTSGNRKASVNKIAAYISKYIVKSFETGGLNKKRYWASRNIGKVVKTFHLLRPDWSTVDVLLYIKELCEQYQVKFRFDNTWQKLDKDLFWMAASG